MANTLNIRSIEQDEIDEAVRLIDRSVSENPDGFLASPKESHKDYIFRLMEQRTKGRGDFLIGTFDEKIVAVGGLDAEGMKRLNPDGLIPECGKIHVAPEYQGYGFGYAMARELIEKSRDFGFETVQLHVTKTQEKAISLYRKLGFQSFHDATFTVDGQVFPTLFFKLAI